MKKTALFILAFYSFVCQSSPAYAEDKATHSAYKVTTYNLGTILDSQGNESSRFLTDFRPLLITSNVSDILNNEHMGKVSLGEGPAPPSNTSGVALAATFDATQKISLQGAFGITRNLSTPNSLNYENESSWEANLGVIYKLLNNLSYELHFGYMDTGTLFNDRSSYTNVESIIMISNQLSLSF
jgi:hypothetical protein